MSAVKIVLGNLFSCIFGDVPNTVQYNLVNRLSYKLQNSYYMLSYMQKKYAQQGKNMDWDGNIRLYWPEKNHSFYTGMQSVVKELLKEAGIPYVIEDRRSRPPENLPGLIYTPPKDHERREYQEATIDLLYKATRGIMQVATGGGKTSMTAELIGRIKTGPFIFFVLSQDLLEQAHDVLSGCFNVPIGKIAGGVCKIHDINVATVQTAVQSLAIAQHKKFNIRDYQFDEDDHWEDVDLDTEKARNVATLLTSAKGLYFDEVHHVASRTCKEVVLAAKQAYWRFGGSATPFREDGAEMMIQALFGRKIVDISLSYLIREGYLLRPFIFFVDMGSDDHGKWASYPQIYKHYVVDNDYLNENVVSLVKFFEQKGITSLTLVKQYEHGENLQRFYPDIHFIRGDQTRKQRKDAIESLRTGQLPSAIATTLADEGLDVRRLNAAIVAGGGKSLTRVYQRVGRTLRPFGKQDRAVVVFFGHRCRFLSKHDKRIRNLLKKEGEFIIRNTTMPNMISDIEAALCEDMPLRLN